MVYCPSLVHQHEQYKALESCLTGSIIVTRPKQPDENCGDFLFTGHFENHRIFEYSSSSATHVPCSSRF